VRGARTRAGAFKRAGDPGGAHPLESRRAGRAG